MSAQAEGVFIQDVNGKLWNAEDWDKSVEPNGVAVISKRSRFLIALANLGFLCQMSNCINTPFETVVETFNDKRTAKTDYDGFKNTESIANAFCKNYHFAAGWCREYTFPDGKTKGYLPSFGQFWVVYRNKDAVNAAFKACGGFLLNKYPYYWTSTFCKGKGSESGFWMIRLVDGDAFIGHSLELDFVRPFADL